MKSALQPSLFWSCVIAGGIILAANALAWPFIPVFVHRLANRVNDDIFKDVWKGATTEEIGRPPSITSNGIELPADR